MRASSRPTGWRRARASRSAPIAPRREAAIEASLVGGAFGDAGRVVVVEELLVGDEVSLLALCHGQTARPLAAAQDFKRVGDGDTGPNTGGMGAYSPVPWFDDAATADAARLVHEPLLAELARRGIPFSGCLYAGLMLTADGPRVLEYNVRFGDPETQALVARFDGDLAAALAAIAHGAPDEVALGVGDDAAVTLVLRRAGLSRGDAHRPADHGHRARRGAARGDACSTRAPRCGTGAWWSRRAACSASRRRPRRCTSRASGPWRAQRRSNSKASTCAATSRCGRPRRKHVSDVQPHATSAGIDEPDIPSPRPRRPRWRT